MRALRAGLDTGWRGPSASERSPTRTAGSPQQCAGPPLRRYARSLLTLQSADERTRTPVVTPATSELRCVSFHAAAALVFLLLAGCGSKPPIVSADTSCERFAHISFHDAQIAAVQADWTLWESVADQVVAHNIEYDKSCLGPTKP